METSLRYSGDSKSVRIHAKEKFPLPNDSKFVLQAHGELDTRSGSPSYLAVLLRSFFPELSASIGLGWQFNKYDKYRYHIRAKKAFPLTPSGLVSLNMKGRYYLDKDFNERRNTGGLEFSWAVLNFQKDQDVRLRIGYDVFDQVPYFQLRENNWTVNAFLNGRWNVRFDL